MSHLKRLLQEVHQRSLWQLLASYIVGAWLVLQIAETLASLIGLPLWFGAGVIALLAFGLVLVLTTGLVQVVVAYRSAPDRSYGGLRRLFSWKHALIAGLVGVAVLAVGTGGYMGLRAMGVGPMGSLVAKGVLEPGERIVLADFENLTRDSTDAIVVTEALRTDLAQSRPLRLAEPEYVRRVLARMEKDANAPLDETLAREVAVRQGLRAVLAGQVSQVGAGYVLSARMVAPETGEAIDGWRETARDSTGIIDAIDRLSKAIRERAGESLKTIRRSQPLAQVTTGSLEALKKYSEAVWLENVGSRDRAISLLEEAIALDSNFAAAYVKLSAIYFNEDQPGAVEAASKAYEWRDRLAEPERHGVVGFYHMTVTGDLDRAIDAYRTLVEISDSTAGLNNLAILYGRVHDFGAAERLYQRALLVADSLDGNVYYNLANTQTRMGKFDEARRTWERFAEKLPDWAIIRHSWLADLAAYRGDYSTAEAHIEARGALGDTPDQRLDAQALASFMRANLALLQGRLGEARRHYRDAVSTEERRGATPGFYEYATFHSLVHVWFAGDSATTTQIVETALERHPLSEVAPQSRPYLELARFYALANQPKSAREMLDEYETTWPPAVRGYWGSSVYHLTVGAVALAEGRYEESIRLLRVGDDEAALLGRAYDLAGEADSAVAFYERYVSHPAPGRTLLTQTGPWNDPFWLPLIYERLGDLYEQRGDTAQAIHYYGKLIELWKDADPELQPRVDAARRAIEALSTDR